VSAVEHCAVCGEELCCDEGFEEWEVCADCRDGASDLEGLFDLLTAKESKCSPSC
jgi:hypothetical protein